MNITRQGAWGRFPPVWPGQPPLGLSSCPPEPDRLSAFTGLGGRVFGGPMHVGCFFNHEPPEVFQVLPVPRPIHLTTKYPDRELTMKTFPKIQEPSNIDRILASTGPLTTTDRQALLDRRAEIDVEEREALKPVLQKLERLEAELVKDREELAAAELDEAAANRDLAAAWRRALKVPPHQTTLH